jgi:pyridoxal phosphate enzyme (YggS family)
MIQERLENIKKALPENVTLIAVSKTKPSEAILEAYRVGQRHFGENKVQELVDKASVLPKVIYWHFIGHLQTNKVKFIAPFIHLIHSVDSFKLLNEINRQGFKNNREIQCLLQFHIAQEESKFGMDLNEAISILSSPEFTQFKHVKICGVMGMASLTNDLQQIRMEFQQLKCIYSELKNTFFSNDPSFSEISMGMSNDYLIAIEEGSTKT